MSTGIEECPCKLRRTGGPETEGDLGYDASHQSGDSRRLRRWRSAPFNYPGYSPGQTSRNMRVHGQSIQAAYLRNDVGIQVDDQHGNNTDEANVDDSLERILIESHEQKNGNGHQIASHWLYCLNRKVTIEWIFVVSNFLLEILSAVSDQLSSPHQPKFALISMLMSVVIMLICFYDVTISRKEMVRWRRSHMLTDIVGLVCAILQCVATAVAYSFYSRHSDNPIKVNFYPIIFSIGIICSKFAKTRDNGQIPTHGDLEAGLSRNLRFDF